MLRTFLAALVLTIGMSAAAAQHAPMVLVICQTKAAAMAVFEILKTRQAGPDDHDGVCLGLPRPYSAKALVDLATPYAGPIVDYEGDRMAVYEDGGFYVLVWFIPEPMEV